MNNYIDLVLESLISQGVITQEEFDKLVDTHVQAIKDDPNSAPNRLDVLKEENLDVMEAAAELYETNLQLQAENEQLKQQNLDAMSALADVYELILTNQPIAPE